MLMLLVVALGVLAATRPVTSVEVRADMALQSLGWPGATSASIGLTNAAQEAVGLIVLGLALVLLVLQGRRFDAVRLLAMAGAAFLALTVSPPVLAKRFWKRSTRPAVSTNFCWPV